MRKNIWITTALAMMLGLGLITPSEAKGKCGKCIKADLYDKFVHKAKFFKGNADELGLSKDQVKSIRKIKLATKKEAIKLKADIKILKLDIKDALMNHKIDTGKVNGLVDKKYNLKAKKAKTLIKGIADMKAVLSEKQYDKAIAVWKAQEKGKCAKCGTKKKCSGSKCKVK